MSFYDRVYEAVCRIPKGKVATYGQIAMLAGSPRASRVVGYALHVNPKPGGQSGRAARAVVRVRRDRCPAAPFGR